MSRLNFRPRQLDKERQLPIVRDVSQLDAVEPGAARDVAHNHAALDQANEPVRTVKTKQGKEIPVPEVRLVPTYNVDYLPTFKPPTTYIHGKGGVGFADENFVEYDLDRDDEEWLAELNGGQERLTAAKLEAMLWTLEVKNAQCTDNALAAAGASLAERMGPVSVASTEHMTIEQAMDALRAAVNTHDGFRTAVYQYWRKKRKALGKPLMRRLQAPTANNDTNPFNVFRPRERIHRPQTRRRRDNNQESMDKLRMLKDNLSKAKEVMELMLKRERKKRDLVYLDVEAAQIKIKLRHEPPAMREAIESEYQGQLKAKGVKRPLGFEGSETAQEAKLRKQKKKKREGRKTQPDAVAQLPPPPLQQLDEPMLFADSLPPLPQLLQRLQSCRLPQGLEASQEHVIRPRVGRGGRLWLDRCDPFELCLLSVSLSDADDIRPMHQQLNPYSNRPGLQTPDRVQSAKEKAMDGSSSEATPAGVPPAVQPTPGTAAPPAMTSPPGRRGPGRPPKAPRPQSSPIVSNDVQ